MNERDETKTLETTPPLNEIYFKFKYRLSVVDVKCIKNHRLALDPFHHMFLAVYKFFHVLDQYMDQTPLRNDKSLVELLSNKETHGYHYVVIGIKDIPHAKNIIYELFTNDTFHTFWKEISFLDMKSSSLLDQQMRLVAKCCPNLKSLSIKSCKYITDIGIQYIAIGCPNLETIDISRSPTDQHGGNITDQVLADLTQACTKLKDINISFCQNVGDLGFESIAENCPGVHTIRAAGCSQLTDKSVSIVSSELSHLRTLNLDGCLNLTVVFFSKALSNICLREISTENCHRISDLNMKTTEIPAILPSLSAYRIQSRVRHLTMSDCTKVDDGFVINLSDFCPELKFLDVRGCHKLTDKAIDVLVKKCTLLEKLDISGGSARQAAMKLTDASCSSIAEYCKRLKHLCIAKNPNITLKTFVDLFDGHPQITIGVTCVRRGIGITYNELNDLANRLTPDLLFSYHSVDRSEKVERIGAAFTGNVFLHLKRK